MFASSLKTSAQLEVLINSMLFILSFTNIFWFMSFPIYKNVCKFLNLSEKTYFEKTWIIFYI